MFTHASTTTKAFFAAIFAVAIAFSAQSAFAGEYYNSPNVINEIPFDDKSLSSDEYVDAIDAVSNVDTYVTIDDPRVLRYEIPSTVMVDIVDHYYPMDTSAVAMPNPEYPYDDKSMSSMEYIDTINRLDAGERIP